MRERLTLNSKNAGQCWRFRARARPAGFSHSHDELELNLATAGRAGYLVKDHRFELRRGSLLWLFPEQEHLLIDQSPQFEMWILVVRPAFLRRICRDREHRILQAGDPAGDFCSQLSEAATLQLAELLASVALALPDSDRLRAGLAFVLLEAWRLHQAAEASLPMQRVHPCVEQAARLLHTQDGRMPLPQLARTVGLSPSRLSRLFGKQMGLTLVEYRQRRLIERFLDRFARYPDHKLASLALEAGFGSYPQFHRVFTKLIGRTPAAFVRRSD